MLATIICFATLNGSTESGLYVHTEYKSHTANAVFFFIIFYRHTAVSGPAAAQHATGGIPLPSEGGTTEWWGG